MSAYQPVRRGLLYASAAALCLAGVESTTVVLTAQERGPDEELQLGQAVFNQLKAKAEIIESSPLYDPLKPISALIQKQRGR